MVETATCNSNNLLVVLVDTTKNLRCLVRERKKQKGREMALEMAA
jgi:hypothetical protein